MITAVFHASFSFFDCVCVDVKESWLYHLSVAAGAALGKVGTEFEQLVGELYQQDGDPSESLDPFCSSPVGFRSFFTWPLRFHQFAVVSECEWPSVVTTQCTHCFPQCTAEGSVMVGGFLCCCGDIKTHFCFPSLWRPLWLSLRLSQLETPHLVLQ